MMNIFRFRYLKLKKLSIWVGIALLSLMISLFWFTPKTVSQDLTYLNTKGLKNLVEFKELEARKFLLLVVQKQRKYRMRTKFFASRFSDLGITNLPKSRSYNYKIVFSDATKMLVTAKATENGLKSYIGGNAVAYGNGDEGDQSYVIAAICGTDKPSKTIPNNVPKFRLNSDLASSSCPPPSITICVTQGTIDHCYPHSAPPITPERN